MGSKLIRWRDRDKPPLPLMTLWSRLLNRIPDPSNDETEPIMAYSTRDETDVEMVAHGADTQKPLDIQTETIESVETTVAGKDKAVQLLKAAGHSVVVTPEENKRILKMIDWHILPIILTIYCLQSLDKTALSYASVFGIIDDLHLHGHEYSWSGAIVYVAQLVWQPLIAYFLVKLPLGKFCGLMVFCWGESKSSLSTACTQTDPLEGATLCGMTAAKDFGGLMAARFILGSFEASVAPTFIALVQMWYRRSEQTNRNAAWYSMLGIVNIVRPSSHHQYID